MRKGNKAQSTLEYVIILTAIVGAILFAATKIGSKTDDTAAVNKMMSDSKTAITNATGRLANISPGS